MSKMLLQHMNPELLVFSSNDKVSNNHPHFVIIIWVQIYMVTRNRKNYQLLVLRFNLYYHITEIPV